MKPSTVLARADTAVNAWLTAPERNAAGRMGIFRILYSAFYIWYLAANPAETVSGYALLSINRIRVVEVLPTLSPVALQLLEAGLVAALVLLALGYRTRIATGAVLTLGIVVGAVSASVDVERSVVLLVALIPLLMLAAGDWRSTHSLDAVRAHSQGRPVVSPQDTSGEYFMGAHALLLMLVLLFASAGVSKLVLPTSTWLTHPDLVGNLVLEFNVSNAINGLPSNPTAEWISQTEVASEALRFGVVIFELSFVLALFSRTWRQMVIGLALVFHSGNALVLGVTFTPVLVAYLPFVDWQGLLDKLTSRREPRSPSSRSSLPAVMATALALVVGALWYAGDLLQQVVTIGGALDQRTIWYVVLPLALASVFLQLVAIVKRLAEASPARDL